MLLKFSFLFYWKTTRENDVAEHTIVTVENPAASSLSTEDVAVPYEAKVKVFC